MYWFGLTGHNIIPHNKRANEHPMWLTFISPSFGFHLSQLASLFPLHWMTLPFTQSSHTECHWTQQGQMDQRKHNTLPGRELELYALWLQVRWCALLFKQIITGKTVTTKHRVILLSQYSIKNVCSLSLAGISGVFCHQPSAENLWLACEWGFPWELNHNWPIEGFPSLWQCCSPV